MNRLRHRLEGLAATVLLTLLVIGLPAALIAIGAAPWDADLGELRRLLTSPDDGTLALVVFALVAWIAWAVMAVSVAVEATAQLRGLSAPSIPGLALPQRAAGQLVAVAALLFMAAPVVVSAFPAPPVRAATAPPVPEPPRPEVAAQVAPVPTVAPVKREQSTIDYTVKRGDSLWKIAERLLGDGVRYPEIVELNQGVLNGRPDFISAGTVLKVPHEATPPDEGERPSEQYVVRPGDTLSEIAEDKLGDPARYPEIFEASQPTVQPDGAHLTDPDLIRPGWELTIPGTGPVEHDPVEPHHQVGPPAEAAPPAGPPAESPVEPPATEPTPDPTTEPRPSPDPTATATADNTNGVDEESSPGWLLPGLTGAGALLAGAVLLRVRAHRRTQLRYRRPGQTIAPPPPELAGVEKTAFVSGAPLAEGIEQLDRLLRHLAATMEAEGRALPVLAMVTLAARNGHAPPRRGRRPPVPVGGRGRRVGNASRRLGPGRRPDPALPDAGHGRAGRHRPAPPPQPREPPRAVPHGRARRCDSACPPHRGRARPQPVVAARRGRRWSGSARSWPNLIRCGCATTHRVRLRSRGSWPTSGMRRSRASGIPTPSAWSSPPRSRTQPGWPRSSGPRAPASVPRWSGWTHRPSLARPQPS